MINTFVAFFLINSQIFFLIVNLQKNVHKL